MDNTALNTAHRPSPARARKRGLFGLATAVAAVVAAIFATVGDGVKVPDADGARHFVIEHGHTLVWVLLTAAFATATVRGKWSRLPNAIAVAAGVTYALFLVAVFVWR